MMAKYNERVNEQLLTHCQELSDEQLLANTHSFFPTIMAYWNHILFGDLIILGRLANNNIANLASNDFDRLPTAKSVHDVFCENMNDIILLRKQVDALINQYCDHLTNEACQSVISYQSTEGENITIKVGDITQHLFNHQTHHRGQLTCILSQLGVDYGCMDLPVLVREGSTV